MIEATTASFEADVLAADGTVLVDFWAPWCGPCRALAPFLEQIAAERADVTVVKLNIDDEPEIAERYGVLSIPTVIRFDDGAPTQTVAGLKPKAMLMRALAL